MQCCVHWTEFLHFLNYFGWDQGWRQGSRAECVGWRLRSSFCWGMSFARSWIFDFVAWIDFACCKIWGEHSLDTSWVFILRGTYVILVSRWRGLKKIDLTRASLFCLQCLFCSTFAVCFLGTRSSIRWVYNTPDHECWICSHTLMPAWSVLFHCFRSYQYSFVLFIHNVLIPVIHSQSSQFWSMIPLQVRGGQLWGTDVYTDDSDLVAGKSWFVFMVLSWIICRTEWSIFLNLPVELFSSHAYWLLPANCVPSSSCHSGATCYYSSITTSNL